MADIARDAHVASTKRYDGVACLYSTVFFTNVLSALASGKYSDLTITCGKDTYKVHKNIVCLRSGFFERAERFGKVRATY
jgi:hypothetical protein